MEFRADGKATGRGGRPDPESELQGRSWWGLRHNPRHNCDFGRERTLVTYGKHWSGRRDLNPRPPAPKVWGPWFDSGRQYQSFPPDVWHHPASVSSSAFGLAPCLGSFHLGLLQRGHIHTGPLWRGVHLCSHRKHSNVGSLHVTILLMELLIHHVAKNVNRSRAKLRVTCHPCDAS